MKRLLSLMLAMMMIFALASCEGGFLGSSKDPSELTLDLSHLGAETLQGMTQKDILKQIDKYEPTGQIIQGSTTQLNGDFVSGWTNSATNAEIKQLMSGYSTLAFTKEGMYIFDPITLKEWRASKCRRKQNISFCSERKPYL